MYFTQQKLVLNVKNVTHGEIGHNVRVTMEVGMVSNEYQTDEYFDWPLQNIIGLAPSIPESNPDLLKRQFLYQFAQQYDCQESYALFGQNLTFLIGGTVEEYLE